jgi:branched-subunit amino acid transport protein AzlD
MKSSLATVSVAIRILIRFLILILFSQKSSSTKAGFLEALFGISVLGDSIVGRVLTAFGSGVANPLIGMMLTLQVVVFAIHNLSDRFSLLGKELLPSPFLILVLLCFAGILRSAFVLLRRRLGNAKLVDLSREG